MPPGPASSPGGWLERALVEDLVIPTDSKKVLTLHSALDNDPDDCRRWPEGHTRDDATSSSRHEHRREGLPDLPQLR